jgi:hypothetical protein
MKEKERQASLQKQMQSDILDQRINASKRILQNHLANDYGNAMRRRQMRSLNERTSDINSDLAANNRARQELDYLNASDNKKKQYIQQMFINEKKLYDLSKENDNKKQKMLLREDQSLLNESVRQSYDREAIFKNRYQHFNKFQEKVADSYSKKVLSPEIEKKYKFDSIVKQQVNERNKKLDEMERFKNTFYQNWNQSNKNVLVNQMNYQQDKVKDELDKRNYERRERMIKQNEIETADYLEQQQKKQMQSKYKEMLDSQRRLKDEYRSYGNMTNVEKCLNRNDLLAWKNYDYTTYAMIPGFNSSNLKLSQKVEQERGRKQKIRDLDKQVQRLNIYHHSLNKVKNEIPNADYLPLDQSTEINPHHRNVQSNSDLRRSLKETDVKRNLSVDNMKSVPSTLYKSIHPKYTKHHLYTPFDPISGSFNNHSPSDSRKGFQLRHSFAF